MIWRQFEGQFAPRFISIFGLNRAVNRLQLWYPPLKNVLDAALMTAAYCGVSIAYRARDAIFGLVLWQIHDLIVPSVRVRRCQQRALLTHIFKSSGVETFGRSQSILFKNLWSAIAMQPKCGKYFWDHCCQWWAQALERHAARHQFPNYCLEKVKCHTICDNNSFKTYLKVHHTCRARQKRIEIEIDAKFQNASGGVLENSLKSESESFIEADVKSSTVIPPNRVYLQPAPKSFEYPKHWEICPKRKLPKWVWWYGKPHRHKYSPTKLFGIQHIYMNLPSKHLIMRPPDTFVLHRERKSQELAHPPAYKALTSSEEVWRRLVKDTDLAPLRWP